MTSRERVCEALAHRETDRVPIDLGSSIVSSVNAVAYGRLKNYMGFRDPRPKVNQLILLLPEIDQEILDRWNVDVLPLDRYEAGPGLPRTRAWVEHPLPDGSPALFPEGFAPVVREDGIWELYRGGRKTDVLSPVTSSFVPVYFPLEYADLEALESFDIPAISDEELEYLHNRARFLYENTDKAVFGWFNGSIFEQAQFLCGFDGFMYRLAGEPEFASLLLEKLTVRVIEDLKRYLDAVGSYIQIMGFGDDFGIQNGPQISPPMFRTFIKPLLKRIYTTSHGLSKAAVFLHSCGSVYEFIEDFIEIGVDILNPVQTSAYRMDPEALKREFGDRICFWGGGCDVQHILPFGTPDQVREDVRRRMEIFSKGGGFVFAPIHVIQSDVPPENIVAMYEAAREYGKL